MFTFERFDCISITQFLYSSVKNSMQYNNHLGIYHSVQHDLIDQIIEDNTFIDVWNTHVIQ